MSTTSRTLPTRALRMLLLWPVFLLWRLATITCNAIGIVFSIIVALALLGAGYLLISTFIGIILGLPLILFGAFLLARALY
ncbi:MAG: hypothetical protein IID09_07265 [Candidatus Hydrogenedentes bacterium]|nr:hypothetical protein [Candidatus Hydrogenedentota bacterium]